MNKYEIMYILHPTANIIESVNKIEGIILTNKGEIIEKNDWGIMKLAYPIQKQLKGHYVVLICNTDKDNITELLRINKIDKNILRILILSIDKEKEYVQSTKLSKTEIKEEKIEHKTIGKKYERRVIKLDSSNPKDVTTKSAPVVEKANNVANIKINSDSNKTKSEDSKNKK